MKKITIIFILVLTLVSMSGCSTYLAHKENFSEDFKIYSATTTSSYLSLYFIYAFTSSIMEVNDFNDVALGCTFPIAILAFSMDFPIAIVSDTLFLPIDVYRWNFPKNNIEPIKKSNQEELKTNHPKNQKS